MPEVAEMAAVAEPVESAAVETSVETPVSGEETAQTVDSVDSPEQKQDLTEKTSGKGKLNLAEVAKTKGDALKAIDPALPAAVRTAAFELGSLYREFPGGLKEAVTLKNAISEYGGVDGLKESAETLSGMQTLAQSFFDGKPDFVNNLVEESPQAFSQMMPTGLEKWKSVDPEMYNHVQASVMVQTLDGFKASETLAAIYRELPDGPAKNAVEHLWNQIDGFRKAAEKAPERKTTPKDDALTQREQALAERESKAMLMPVKSEGLRHIQTITDREMGRGYQWDKTDADVQQAVRERIQQEIAKASGKDQTFVREFDRMKARGDSAGLTKLVTGFQERVGPGIIQRVAKLFAVKPKGAPVAVADKKPPVVANGNGRQSQDWERVAKMPSAKDLDMAAMGRNYEDMIMANRGILKGGKRVQWA